MDWARAVVAALAVPVFAAAGCATQSDEQAAQNAVTPGEASATRDFFGWQMQPCTQLELDGYPTNIARASQDYYQGPWCARDGANRVYLWAYAREMGNELTLDEVRQDVTLDAEQLTLDLAAQGYLRVCGEVVVGGPVDVALEEPGNAQQIRVAAVGQSPVSMDPTASQPLALVVAVGPASGDPAFPPELSAPACAPLGSAEVTVAAGDTGLPTAAPEAQ